MESRLIYKATHALKHLVEYDEWVYFGTKPEIKLEIVSNMIESTFMDEVELLLIHERTNSCSVERNSIIDKIAPLLGEEKFFIWNKKMDKSIEFNSIGVMRKGIIKKTTYNNS